MAELDIEKELKRFNWGAFWWSWIWGLSNSVKHWTVFTILGIWCLSIILPILNIIIGNHPIITLLILLLELTRLGLKVYLGIIGNRLAYSAKTYDSIQSFRDVQRTWAVLTLAVFLIGGCAIVAAMTLPVLVNSLNT